MFVFDTSSVYLYFPIASSIVYGSIADNAIFIANWICQ